MKVFSPQYYYKFSCIADRCKHNCCIGWEIDIDYETLKKYKKNNSEFKERLKSNISYDDETPHFILSENERCPFLNKNNLCDIICELGEDYLCQICSDHPRFVNCFSDSDEIGLGLSCEEAARIILSSDYNNLISLNDEKCKYDKEEKLFINERKEIFDIIKKRDISLKKRIEALFIKYNITFDFSLKYWSEKLSSLEKLDNQWSKMLDILSTSAFYSDFMGYDIIFERLLIYFIYRHLFESIYDGYFKERLVFSVFSTYIIWSLCINIKKEELTFYDIVNIARMYSSEIEYSTDNTYTLIYLISEKINEMKGK